MEEKTSSVKKKSPRRPQNLTRSGINRISRSPEKNFNGMSVCLVIAFALLGSGIFFVVRRSLNGSPSKPTFPKSALLFGNPLFELIDDTGIEYIRKHRLYPDEERFKSSQFLYSPEVLEILSSFSADPQVEKVAGGASQNSARVMSILPRFLGEECLKVSITGTVGDDEDAQCMRKSCIESGVEPCYQVEDDCPSGKRAVMFYNESEETLYRLGLSCKPAGRTVVTSLNAAYWFEDSQLKDSFLEKFDMFYTEGFFILTSLDTLLRAAKHAHANHKPFIINLSSKDIYPDAYDGLMQLLPYATAVFGNEEEFPAVWNLMVSRGDVVAPEEGFSLASFAARLGTMEFDGVPAQSRTVVVTRGTDPAVVYNPATSEVTEFPIFNLKNKDLLRDTHSAGDSYVGGFLSGLALDKPLEDCMQRASLGAGIIVQMRGCSFPKTEAEFIAIVQNLEAPEELMSKLTYPTPIISAATATA